MRQRIKEKATDGINLSETTMYLHVVDTELHPCYGNRHSIHHSGDTMSVGGPGPTSSL